MLRKSDTSFKTKTDYLAALKQFFRWCVALDYCSCNPFDGLTAGKRPSGRADEERVCWHRQIQLAPHLPLFGAVFPFAFTKYLKTSRIDNHVGDIPLGGLPIGHFHRADSLADSYSSVHTAQRHIHQLEQGVE
ncbi:hypothetical protein WH06_00665 [Aeromonas salmonicida subsp. salmonicida]|nr:hypothetical protein WH06_00665 [Aeromonas salmonicida subsp. salmonicida]